jgi:hypothetical protein
MHGQRKTFLRRVASIALVAVLALALSSCKDTNVLTQLIQDQVNGEMDYSAEPIVKIAEGQETDSNPRSRAEDELAFAGKSDYIPVYGENSNTVQTTAQRAQTENGLDSESTLGDSASDSDGNANDGNAPGGNAGSGSGSADNGTEKDADLADPGAPDDSDGDNEGDGEDTTAPRPGNGDQGGENTGGRGGIGSVYNDATYAELPAGTRTVAAVGDYALIVQMLAGKGALVAADANWLGKVQALVAAGAAFQGEGLDKVKATWSGDGKTAGNANIDALIAAKPDVVLVGSNTSTLTQPECDRLVAAGINVVVMPAIGVLNAADKDILTAVRVVGKLLERHVNPYTNMTALAMASEYIRQHDDAINNTLSANGGYSYKISGSRSYPFIYQDGSHLLYGTPTTWLSNNRYYTAYADSWVSSPISSAWTDRGIGPSQSYITSDRIETINLHDSELVEIDGFALCGYSSNTGQAFAVLQYYLQCAGVIDYGSNGYASQYTNTPNFPSKPYAIGSLPLFGEEGRYSVRISSTNGSSDIFWGYASSLRFYDSFGIHSIRNGASETVTLSGTYIGDPVYPAVITRDANIARRITDSANKVYGYYNVRGLADMDRTQLYEAWVVPSGLAGSWVDGNVESFLIAPWAYSMFQMGKDITACTTYVNDFYSAFYRAGAAGIVSDYGNDGIFHAYCPAP